ncbi:hypothetical protein SAMN05216241_106155 [Limimonas halophila]|uniref:Uncharacterized protein n=1 Tax=Limimonas halophila TaxID=1082479 RepID=A0A1G7S7U1_9PROT|nr:hypothetical protein [Limimonas halophila]SDG19115.1 hypothetical protein SAMN05216241_106155 [Limimonas halophila]
MTHRLLRAALVLLILAALVVAAGWTVATVPVVRDHLAEGFNAAGEAYIRFVFRLYQLVSGRGDGPEG